MKNQIKINIKSLYYQAAPGYQTPTPPLKYSKCGLKIPGENIIKDVPKELKIRIGIKHFYAFV